MTKLYLGHHIPDEITRYSSYIRPESNEVLAEMETQAEREGFPIIGPEVGAWLCQLARIGDAKRIFEFGSGFGYSACWFARALPEDGEIVLTEYDGENLERARENLERVGAAELAAFEEGDAIETATNYEGPFDIVLIDVDKHQYVDAFETIRESVRPGGMIVADNTMSAGEQTPDDKVDFETLLAAVDEPSFDIEDTSLPEETKVHTEGILRYLTHVREAEAFESTLLPLGDGVTVTVRIE